MKINDLKILSWSPTRHATTIGVAFAQQATQYRPRKKTFPRKSVGAKQKKWGLRLVSLRMRLKEVNRFLLSLDGFLVQTLGLVCSGQVREAGRFPHLVT